MGGVKISSKGVAERCTEQTSYRSMEQNGTEEAAPTMHKSLPCSKVLSAVNLRMNMETVQKVKEFFIPFSQNYLLVSFMTSLCRNLADTTLVIAPSTTSSVMTLREYTYQHDQQKETGELVNHLVDIAQFGIFSWFYCSHTLRKTSKR